MESNELCSGERKGRRKERRLLLALVRAREGAGYAGRKTARRVLPELPETNGAKKVKIWADPDTNDRADPNKNCRAKRTKGGGGGGGGHTNYNYFWLEMLKTLIEKNIFQRINPILKTHEKPLKCIRDKE
jgi:hypothetical protein